MVKKETVIETITTYFIQQFVGGGDNDVIAYNEKLRHLINALPEDDGWIPVEERLPEISNGYASPRVRVTVQGREGELEVTYSRRLKYLDEEYWAIEFEAVCGAARKVLAWQPLPTPYAPPEQPSKLPQSWKKRTMSEFERVE